MGSTSRKSARIVEGVVILCIAATAALAGWRIVESRYPDRVADAGSETTNDCREAERYCGTQCLAQADECVESCMSEFACAMNL